MSEYQYYEFLAVDRPLGEHEMGELRSVSSRAEITPTHFSNEYHYGDLKADPRKLLEAELRQPTRRHPETPRPQAELPQEARPRPVAMMTGC
jgi:hypothetical protein